MDNKTNYKIISCFIIVEFFAAADISGLTVMIPIFQKYFMISETTACFIMTGYLAMFTICLIPLGLLADKFGLKKCFITGVCGFAMFSLACSFANTINTLIFFRALKGIFAAGIFATEVALVIRYWHESYRMMELVLTGFAVGILIGPVLGGIFAKLYFWQGFFLSAFIFCIICLYLCKDLKNLVAVEKSSHELIFKKQSLVVLIKKLFTLCAINFILSFSLASFNLFITLHIQNEKMLSPMFNSVVLITISLGMFIAFILNLGSKYIKNPRNSIIISSLSMSVCFVFFYFVSWVSVPVFMLFFYWNMLWCFYFSY